MGLGAGRAVTPVDPLTVAVAVDEVLDRLAIPYVIGGSVASSVLGEPRSTLDLDIMIDANDAVRRLAIALSPDFHVDQEEAVDSFRQQPSFNAIHFGTAMKVNFFPAEALGRQQIARRKLVTARPGAAPLYFYSAEDLIIRKLLWFRAGNETSSRQWRDVVSLIKLAPIDPPTLLQRAREQSVEDLLLRAAREAGHPIDA
jgi:hypothetical protein